MDKKLVEFRIEERDMDILFARELILSEAFFNLFLNAVGIKEGALLAVKKSFVQPHDEKYEQEHNCDIHGENDIVVEYMVNNKICALLIENKIDATAQPAQPQRYKARCKYYESKDNGYFKCDNLIIAPQDYLEFDEAAKVYDNCISYDRLLVDYFEKDTSYDSYLKQDFIKKAINKASGRYKPGTDNETTLGWRAYVQYVNEHYSGKLLLYGNLLFKRAGSDTAHYELKKNDKEYRSVVSIKHIPKKHVVLSFEKTNKRIQAKLLEYIESILGPMERAGITVIRERTRLYLKARNSNLSFPQMYERLPEFENAENIKFEKSMRVPFANIYLEELEECLAAILKLYSFANALDREKILDIYAEYK